MNTSGAAEQSGEFEIEIIAYAQDPAAVLDKTKQVLNAVLQNIANGWPDDVAWQSMLPQWFIDACAPERSQKENEEWLASWRKLPASEQARAGAMLPWTLANWLHWFKPGERTWEWWSGVVIEPNKLAVKITSSGLPAPTGALEWLLKASGAVRIDRP